MVEKGREKVTMMKLKVDLECDKCYKKVKKILCKIPQIRDQIFDEKSNTVIIKVVCCSPERVMDKLCSKGGGSIKTIEIIEPLKPQAQPQKPKDVPKVAEKPKEQEKPKQSENPKEPGPKPAHAPAMKQSGPLPPQAVPMMPQGQPISMCHGPSYEGFGGGPPALIGYGIPPQQPAAECYGRPVWENWEGGPTPNYPHYHPIRENDQICSIM